MKLDMIEFRDIMNKNTFAEARRLCYMWADELECYENACMLVSLSFVREFVPYDGSIKDNIPDDKFGRRFRVRVAENVAYRYSMIHQRRIVEKYAKLVEGDVTDALSKELVEVGLDENRAGAYSLLVLALRKRTGGS